MTSSSFLPYTLRNTARRIDDDGTPYRVAESIDLWAQREYVECERKHVGFSAHGDRWLYHFKWAAASPEVLVVDPIARQITARETCTDSLNWIDQAARLRANHG